MEPRRRPQHVGCCLPATGRRRRRLVMALGISLGARSDRLEVAATRPCSGRHTSAPSGRVPTTATAGDSERKPAAAVERLLIVLSMAERTPPPPRRLSGHARALRGRAADAAATQSGGSISASCRRRQWLSSTSSWDPSSPATTSSACLLHGLLHASPGGPHEVRHVDPPPIAAVDSFRSDSAPVTPITNRS